MNLIVDGLPDVGTIDVSADRVLLWTRSDIQPFATGEHLQAADVPLEFYLEGNIVFRQGDRVIRATRMYYDVTNRIGTILEAELLAPVPEYEGLLRLRADVLRQMGGGRVLCPELLPHFEPDGRARLSAAGRIGSLPGARPAED